jgi:hypothetical protein
MTTHSDATPVAAAAPPVRKRIPRKRPAAAYSERITLRVTPRVLDLLEDRADLDGESVSTVIRRILQGWALEEERLRGVGVERLQRRLEL